MRMIDYALTMVFVIFNYPCLLPISTSNEREDNTVDKQDQLTTLNSRCVMLEINLKSSR
jgi:hypothetical protein